MLGLRPQLVGGGMSWPAGEWFGVRTARLFRSRPELVVNTSQRHKLVGKDSRATAGGAYLHLGVVPPEHRHDNPYFVHVIGDLQGRTASIRILTTGRRKNFRQVINGNGAGAGSQDR